MRAPVAGFADWTGKPHPRELKPRPKGKSPVRDGALETVRSSRPYLRLVEIEVNLVFSEVPRLLTTVMIASAMPAAIRPYSMAVAPDSSFKKRATRFFIECSK